VSVMAIAFFLPFLADSTAVCVVILVAGGSGVYIRDRVIAQSLSDFKIDRKRGQFSPCSMRQGEN